MDFQQMPIGFAMALAQNSAAMEAYAALSVKCGTARFTVASVSLYAKDANDMARLTITTTDKTVNTLERVELKDARLKGTYEVLDLGGGQFALCLIPGAKAKTGTANCTGKRLAFMKFRTPRSPLCAGTAVRRGYWRCP